MKQNLTSVFSWILSPRLFSALAGATRRALRTAGRRGENVATFPRLARIVLVDSAMFVTSSFNFDICFNSVVWISQDYSRREKL